MTALRMYEDSLCGACAQSAFHAMDPRNSGEFEVQSVVCLGCEALELAADSSGNVPAGTKDHVHNHMGET